MVPFLEMLFLILSDLVKSLNVFDPILYLPGQFGQPDLLSACYPTGGCGGSVDSTLADLRSTVGFCVFDRVLHAARAGGVAIGVYPGTCYSDSVAVAQLSLIIHKIVGTTTAMHPIGWIVHYQFTALQQPCTHVLSCIKTASARRCVTWTHSTR